MPNDKIVTFFELLKKLTNNGNMQWSVTSDDDIYQSSFSNYSVQISKCPDENGEPDYFITIFDSNGETIEHLQPSDISPPYRKPYLEFSELFEITRRQALGVDQALDDIIKEMKKMEDIPF